MKNPRAWLSRILIVPVVLATVLGSTLLTRGEEPHTTAGPTASPDAKARRSRGVPWDWTHHHVVFSHLGTAEKAEQSGTYERWLKITNDPRYTIQQIKRSGARAALPAAQQVTPAEVEPELSPAETEENDTPDEATAPMTEEDFPGGVLPLGLARALIPPPAQQSEFVSESPEAAASKAPAKRKRNRFHKDWSETEGSNGTTGLGNYPATFTSSPISCDNDFAVYNTGLAGASNQADIIAYYELYNGCTGQPSTYWAYNTGGTVLNSVVLSLDGTQVAFVQSNSSGVASLVLLKWQANPSNGSLTAPLAPTSVAAASYNGCTAPCMTTLTLSGSPSDTYSAPFVAYGSGGGPSTLYVGDDAGMVHKFNNIFATGSNTPAEATSPWPVTLNANTDAALGSPVYDSTSGKIFIGDYLANISSNCQPGISTAAGPCGYLYSINVSSGTVVQSAQLDYNLGIYDSPIVDSSTEMVYVFVGADNSTNCSSGPCAAVFQFPVGFGAGASGTEAQVGAGYEFLMSGSFDNAFFTSSNNIGHLYVVGGTGPADNALYQISISSGTMSTASTKGPVVATNYDNGYYAAGLQVTEFYNTSVGNHDYIFLGVLAFGQNNSTIACPNQNASIGCIMGFDVTSGSVSSSTAATGVLQESGGTSGIVVDNGASGASNIYFSTLLNQSCTGGTGGCATQTLQSAP